MKHLSVIFFLLLSVPALRAQEIAYETLSGIPYYTDTAHTNDAYIAQRCVLDIYYPKNAANFLTIIWFHGGGLSGGEKHIPKELKEQGFCVVAVNYRLHPKAACPAYIEDAAAATAWVFNHIADYGGNPGAIVLSGHSAGAYLSGLIGLDKHWLQAHRIDANRIAGLFLLSAQTITHYTIRKERNIPDTQPVVDEYSLLYHVRPDTPPIYLMTGDREQEMLGRYEENAYLWRMLQLTGNRQVVLYEFDGYGHDMLPPAFPLMIKLLKKFSF
ncbi:MAG: alpha/beta hydrolase fold domain-containing protein [Dysgonamonadaceae bacterium]|jgi:acetyl esterase/lipase|nr:alpha/beta hydrolase fold domain-containing protein [Dysgonamonadaceae bacterium]